MRICVVGAGAIGGFIATSLANAGTDTSVLARGATLGAIRAHGLRVESADGTVTGSTGIGSTDTGSTDTGSTDTGSTGTGKTGSDTVTAKVTASDDATELGEQDVVILAVKAQSAPAAVASARPLFGPDTAVLSTLNGVPWWFFDGFGGPCEGRHLDSVDPGGTIARTIPVARVIGGTVHMSASSPEPGVVRRYSGSGIIIGEPDGTDSHRLESLAAELRKAGMNVTISSSIREDVWYKLWGNLTVNPVSALTGATADQVLDDDLVREFCETAMLETREIGARIGCPILETPADRNLVTRKLGAFRTSMLQDAEAGRPLELDALAGAVREIGAIVGVPTPAVDALYGLTRLSAKVRAQR